MMTSDNDDVSVLADMFAEPQGYYQPESSATFAEHVLQDGRVLKMRLVGHNPLWVRSARPLTAVRPR